MVSIPVTMNCPALPSQRSPIVAARSRTPNRDPGS